MTFRAKLADFRLLWISPTHRKARRARHAAKAALAAVKPTDDRGYGERLKALRSATNRALSIETGRQLQPYGEG